MNNASKKKRGGSPPPLTAWCMQLASLLTGRRAFLRRDRVRIGGLVHVHRAPHRRVLEVGVRDRRAPATTGHGRLRREAVAGRGTPRYVARRGRTCNAAHGLRNLALVLDRIGE